MPSSDSSLSDSSLSNSTLPGSVATAVEILGSLAATQAPLGPFCTYRVGGSAAILVQPDSADDLALVSQAFQASSLPILLVGNGSNLLVSDSGFNGIAVHLGSSFSQIDIDVGSGIVEAGGIATLPITARRTAAAGLTGFEWAVGVPGAVGGAVRMNAGGHGSDMSASLRSVSVFDLAKGEQRSIPVVELELGYRTSTLQPHQVVVSAELGLSADTGGSAELEISSIVAWRRANQPGGANAGSVFANPPNDSSGRLIEQAGLKGFRVGTAEISSKHANFIQADAGGSADDVYRLIEVVKEKILDDVGVELRVENRLVGFDTEVDSTTNTKVV